MKTYDLLHIHISSQTMRDRMHVIIVERNLYSSSVDGIFFVHGGGGGGNVRGIHGCNPCIYISANVYTSTCLI